MSKSTYFTTAALVLGLLVLASERQSAAEPVDPAAVLAPFVNDDTFVAAYFKAAALGIGAANVSSLFAPLTGNPQGAAVFGTGIQHGMEMLTAAKVDAVYVVAGLGDLNTRGGPLVVFHLGAGGRPEDVAKILAPLLPDFRYWHREVEVRLHGANLVLVGARPTLERYASLATAERPELLVPLKKLADEHAALAVVFCPGTDFRRVVRELWPELPGPLVPLRGELADHWLYLEAAINLPPNPKPRIALQAKDAEAAATFVKLVRNLPAVVTEFEQPGNVHASANVVPTESLDSGTSNEKAGDLQQSVKDLLQSIVEIAPPQQNGARVTMTLPTYEQHVATLRHVLIRSIGIAEVSHERREKIQQFKNLALGMLNFESARKHLPPAAICDKDGHPLLSWRVAILPYLGEGELYKQFHLDESWDSPHNRALVAKMPKIFTDPDPKVRQLIGEGKTTYQVPVGSDTVFHNKEGTLYREIKDGTANTILLVEAEPQRAVIWTKPDDWEVDMAHPRRGLGGGDGKEITAAWCDASVQALPADIEEATLRAYVTRAGGENVKR